MAARLPSNTDAATRLARRDLMRQMRENGSSYQRIGLAMDPPMSRQRVWAIFNAPHPIRDFRGPATQRELPEVIAGECTCPCGCRIELRKDDAVCGLCSQGMHREADDD
jgi:hypothetical protein